MSCEPLFILGATVLGGGISLGTTYGMARRAESVAARGAARLTLDDLETARLLIGLALRDGKWWPAAHRADGRVEEGRLQRAAVLTQMDLTVLKLAYQDILAIDGAASDRPGQEIPPERRQALRDSADGLSQALLVLAPYFYAGRVHGPIARVVASRRRAKIQAWLDGVRERDDGTGTPS